MDASTAFAARSSGPLARTHIEIQSLLLSQPLEILRDQREGLLLGGFP